MGSKASCIRLDENLSVGKNPHKRRKMWVVKLRAENLYPTVRKPRPRLHFLCEDTETQRKYSVCLGLCTGATVVNKKFLYLFTPVLKEICVFHRTEQKAL